MEWEQWFCPNQQCTVEFWFARQVARQRDLWQLTDRYGQSPFLIASVDPVCPRCGSSLCTTVELTQAGDADLVEEGPLHAFARSLR